VLSRLREFGEKDMKYYDRTVLVGIFRTIDQFAANTEGLTEQAEKIEMEIVFKLLRSRILDKRVKGINALVEGIQRTNPTHSSVYRYFTPESMAAWLLAEQVKDILLKDRPHIEILKRAQPVLCFLGERGGIDGRDIEELWKGMGEKHESWVRTVYELVEALACVLEKSVLDAVYDQLRTLDLHTCPDFALHTMTRFTRNAAHSLCLSALPTEPYFLLDFNFFISDSSASPLRVQQVSTAIIELLAGAEFESFRKPLVRSLVNGCGASRVAGMLLRMVETMQESVVKDMLWEVEDGLVERIVRCIGEIGQQKGSAEDLSVYLKLLSIISSKAASSKLEDSHFQLLWTQFTSADSPTPHREVFFHWLRTSLEDNSAFLKAGDLLFRVFSEYLCRVDQEVVSILGTEGFLCFQQFFLHVNAFYQTISKESHYVTGRLLEHLHGLDTLILLTLYTPEPSILLKSLRLVAQLHSRVLKSAEAGIVDRFVTGRLTALTALAATGEAEGLIERNLRMLTSIIEAVDYIVTARVAPLTFTDWQIAYYHLPDDSAWKSLHTSKTETIGTLRKAIAKAQRYQADCVKLEYNTSLYTFVDDERVLGSLGHALHFTIRYELHDFVFPSLSDFIGCSEEFQSLLFDLIARPASYRSLLWLILSRLTTHSLLQTKIKELGVTFLDLTEANSFYKELLCLLVLRELKKQEKFVRDMKRIRPGEMMKWLERLERGGGTLVGYFEGQPENLSVVYAQTMLELIFALKEGQGSASRTQATTHILDLLYIYARSIDERTELPRPAIPSCAWQSLVECVDVADLDSVKTCIAAYPHLEDMLICSLRRPKNVFFSHQMKEFFLHLTSPPWALFPQLTPLLLTALPQAIRSTTTSREYFSLLSRLIKQQEAAEIGGCFDLVWEFLREREGEQHPKSEDKGLVGALKVMRAMVVRHSDLRSKEVAEYILVQCLIDPSEVLIPKCKSSPARLAAFKLLSALADDPSIRLYLFSVLSPYYSDLSWRKSKALHWSVSYSSYEKSTTGFVGLRNLGCTCYMNSMLQQLYMLRSFRQGLLVCQSDETEQDTVLYQLQKVMVGLRDSEKMFVQAKGLCEAYKNWEGEAINVREQMDVDEFFNGLMDKTEEGLRITDTPKLVEEHFRGIMTTQCIGRDTCTHKSERDEPFLTIPLEIKNRKSILASLEALVAGEVLEGDNAYECDYCSAKVTAKRRLCIRSLPNVLIFSLRRFDFDMDSMSRIKLNSYCEFPLELDMEQYTLEYLTQQEAPDSDLPKPPASYYLYTLRGIIIHLGYAEAGHYYSFILDSVSGKWLEFNDTLVDEYNPGNIPSDAFGVMERLEGGISKEEIGKLKNAYVLIYERKERFQVKTKDDLLPTPLQPQHDQTTDSPTVSSMHQHVLASNRKYWRHKRLFSPEYSHFIHSLALKPDPDILPFVLAYYFSINIRYKDGSRKLMKYLYEGMGKAESTALWYVEMLSFEPMTKELLFESGVGEGRKFVVGLAEVCLRILPESTQQSFLCRLLALLPKLPAKLTSHHSAFFELLYRLALLNPALCRTLNLPKCLLSLLLKQPFSTPSLSAPFQSTNFALGRHSDGPIEQLPASPPTMIGNLSFPIACLAALQGLDTDDFSLISQSANIVMLTKGVTNRFGANQLARLFADLEAANPTGELYETYAEVLLKQVNEHDYDQHRTLFVQLKRLLLAGNEAQTEKLLGKIVEVLLKNLTYIRATESLIGFLYRLMCRQHKVRDWVAAHIETLQPLASWKVNYQSWTSDSNIGLYLTKVYKPSSAFTEYRINSVLPIKIQLLLELKVPEVDRTEDSDDDLYMNAVGAGKKAEYCPKEEACFRVDILEAYPGCYYYRYEGSDTGSVFFIPAEDDRLLLSGIKYPKEQA